MPRCDFQVALQQRAEITLRHGFSPVNLQHILKHLFLRTPADGYF